MQIDYISAMHHRFSTKMFYDSFLEEDKRKNLIQYIDRMETGPFLSKTHFYLVDTIQLSSDQFRCLHLPKTIQHAYTYLVGTVISAEYDLEDFGYQFEKITLYATSIKLGTCWIGVGFNRNLFAQLIHAKDFEFIPCISPVGLSKKRNQAQEFFFDDQNLGMTSFQKKKPNHFFKDNFLKPMHFDLNSPFVFALDMIQSAPSFKDKQPWYVVFSSTPPRFHFYIHHSLPDMYFPQWEEMIDLQRVDMGAAMCHFELALLQLGKTGQWRWCDPGIPVPSNRYEYVATWTLSTD